MKKVEDNQAVRLPLRKIAIAGIAAILLGTFMYWNESDVSAAPDHYAGIDLLNGLAGTYLGVTLVILGFGALSLAGLFAHNRRKTTRKSV
ncbi:hypothetical protein [Pseudomonas sp. NPDC089569]|uniref:hypothetical protein n=1 Tax=Pseudomonas sp. NPDC089569 TaxID=3390722 RepID=UPI003D00E579